MGLGGNNWKYLVTQVTYTTSGTWTCPAGVTYVRVECWGGGGNGGAGTTPSGSGGSGGGAGGYSKLNSYNVSPGTGYSYTVGIAGADTYFVATSTLLAKGGTAGGANGGAGGTGGQLSAGVGNVKYSGGDGFTTTTNAGGGGGSSGGTASTGNNATTQTGATAVTGGGPGGNGGLQKANGLTPASGPGGGGGGGGGRQGSSTTGGAGFIGQIGFTYEISSGDMFSMF